MRLAVVTLRTEQLLQESYARMRIDKKRFDTSWADIVCKEKIIVVAQVA